MLLNELRVLLIEDSEPDAALLVRELERAGYEPSVTRVTSPAALEQALDRQPWDVVFSDFTLPGFRGSDALQIVRRRDPDVPFIFVSGTIGEERAVEAMKAGANDYILKDNPIRLIPVLRRELRDAKMRQEHRQAERRLADSEARYRLLFERNPFPLWVFDFDTLRFLEVNDAAVQHYGYSRDEFLSMTIEAIRPPEDVAALREHLDAVKRGPSPSSMLHVELRDDLEGLRSNHFKSGPWRHRKKDGSLIVVELFRYTLTWRGRPAALVMAEDVTERRRTEEQLRQAQKMEAVGRLAGGIAHDFNNVLTAVFGYVDLLYEQAPEESSTREDLREIRKAAERAAGLTRQLLAFSRQQVMEPMVLSPNDLVQDLHKMLERLIGEDVELRLVLGQDVGNIRVDPSQVQQVLVNLVVNARDAMPSGGRLVMETANAELSELYANSHLSVVPGRYVMLAVSDTGVGMNAETQARLFEPFFTTKERGKGTGLGLSTTYGIVKQSGGYVWVYSEPGRGTTFKVYFPRVDAPIEEAPASSRPESVAGTETILLAEDDATLRPLTKTVLERLGYVVLEAENGEQALAKAATYQGRIHLLIADVVMPGGSGRDLARRLAASQPDTKVLYVSGYTDDAIVQHGMLEAGLHFLQKPFTPAGLAAKVRGVLDAR
ncbi:MAG: response regulator [Gemmatimonadales bacterium]